MRCDMGMGYRKLDPTRLKIIIIGIGVFGNKIAEKYFDEGFEYVDIYGICTTNDYDILDRYEYEYMNEVLSISKLVNESTLICIISDNILETKKFINDLNACDISGREPLICIVSNKNIINEKLSLSEHMYYYVNFDKDIGMLSLRMLLNYQNLFRLICTDWTERLKQQEDCNTQGVVHGFVNYDDENGEKIARDIKNLCDDYKKEVCGIFILMSNYSLEILDKSASLFSKYIKNIQSIHLADFSSSSADFEVCIVIYSNLSPLTPQQTSNTRVNILDL
jgi:hypothetical protein